MRIVDPEGVEECLDALRERFDAYGYQQFWDAACSLLEPQVVAEMADWDPEEQSSDEGDAAEIPTSAGHDLVDWACSTVDTNPKAWPMIGKFLVELAAHVKARQQRTPGDLQAPKAARAIAACLEDLKTCVAK